MSKLIHEKFWLCKKCGAEYHYPKEIKPIKCQHCGADDFVRMYREIVPLSDWKKDLFKVKKLIEPDIKVEFDNTVMPCLRCGKIEPMLIGGLCKTCIRETYDEQRKRFKELIERIEKLERYHFEFKKTKV